MQRDWGTSSEMVLILIENSLEVVEKHLVPMVSICLHARQSQDGLSPGVCSQMWLSHFGDDKHHYELLPFYSTICALTQLPRYDRPLSTNAKFIQ